MFGLDLLMMRIALDILLVIISTIITIRTYRSIVSFNNVSLAAYVIFICYIFNCLPIAFDLMLGIPEYHYYLSDFGVAAASDNVSMLYDIYMLAAMISFYKYYKKNSVSSSESEYTYSQKYKIFRYVLILSPLLIFLLFVGSFDNYVYTSLQGRDIDSEVSLYINQFMFISLYVFCIWIFSKKNNKFTGLWLTLYMLILAIISGKRFIVAVVLLSYFYSFINSNWRNKRKTNITPVLLVILSLFMGFMIYYITQVKIMGDFTGYIYTQLRVDLGREDVTKFVLMRELEGKPILDFRGQSFVSMLLMIVPRFLWVAKPWPHYRYLTAAIYSETPETISSGMTPSVFEMMVANFSFWGIVLAIGLILGIVKLGDRLRSTNKRLIVLLILIQLFTQSMDVLLFLFYYFIFICLFGKKINKKPQVFT